MANDTSMRSIILEVDPPYLVVDKRHSLSFKAVNAADGSPIEGVSLIGAGGNLRFDHKTDVHGRVDSRPEGVIHAMPGGTPIVFFKDQSEYSASQITIQNVPGPPGNQSEKGLGGLPNQLTVGKTYSFFPTYRLKWHCLSHKSFELTRGQKQNFFATIEPNLEQLHAFVRWYGPNNDISLECISPSGAIISSDRVNLNSGASHKGERVQPPIAQPGNDGIIPAPDSGNWEFVVSNRHDRVNAVLEVYAKHIKAKTVAGTVLRIYGAGIDHRIELGQENQGEPVSITPAEVGIVTFAFESPQNITSYETRDVLE